MKLYSFMWASKVNPRKWLMFMRKPLYKDIYTEIKLIPPVDDHCIILKTIYQL